MRSMHVCKNCWPRTKRMEDEMAKFVDKTRTGIAGVPGLGKVVNETAWGESKALERTRDYGGTGTRTYQPPADRSYPQDPEARRGKDWADDVPENSWLRGGGKGGEGYPNFQPGYKGKK